MSAHTDNTTVQLYGTKDDMERWFLAHGVPHFMHHYSAASQVPVVALLLSIVLAFEVGAAPWLEVDTVGMVLSPLILFVMTLIVLPWLRMIFEAGPWPTLSRLSWTLRATALGAASVLLLLSPLPPPDSVMWVNFALLVSVFAATTMLFSRRVWTSADRGHIRRRRVLLLTVVASVVLFHLEGHAFRSFDGMLHEQVNVPQGLSALAAFVPVLLLASTVARGCPSEPSALDRHSVTANFQLVAVPLLLLLFGLETALLPYSHSAAQAADMQMLAFPLILLIALLVAAAGARRDLTASRGAVLIAVLAPLFVVAYPWLVWMYFDLEILGRTLTGFDAFLASAAINLVYLAIVWFVVSLGLDRLAVWMAREAVHNVRGVAEGVARGLPLLLVFMVFLVMQAELWEVAVEVEPWGFWLMVGAMVLFALAFAVLAARRVVLEKSVFDGLADVAAATREAGREENAPLRADVTSINGSASVRRLTLQLKRMKYLNALAVIVVYQFIVLLPIAAVGAIVFWGLGRIAVRTEVAAQWIYGDSAGKAEAAKLAALPFWEQPWTRVALVLGAFSALYLAVHILSSPEQRQLFCDGADRAMRKRLAVRLAYVWLVPPPPRRVPLRTRAHDWWDSRRPSTQPEAAGHTPDRPPVVAGGET